MKHTSYPFLRTALLASLALTPLTSKAELNELKINDWLSISGYAAVSYFDTDGGDATIADSGASNLDAVKVGLTGKYENFSGYVSLFYVPGAADEAGILDAYLTYKAGDFSITAGKYLSYLGYEAFDLINMSQLTYANTLGGVPAYHNGVKFDYSTDVVSAGVSVSDSIRGGDGFFTGDENFSDDLGFEAYVSYKGIDKLTLWAGLGYEDSAQSVGTWETYDFWASYALTDKLTIAGEVIYHDDGDDGVSGVQGLGFLSYAFTDCFSTVFRVGFDDFQDGDDNVRYTISPTYTISKNFLVRGEISYDSNPGDDNGWLGGVQGVLKF